MNLQSLAPRDAAPPSAGAARAYRAHATPFNRAAPVRPSVAPCGTPPVAPLATPLAAPLAVLGLAAALLLAGCASPSPDAGLSEVAQLASGRTAGVDARLTRAPDAATQSAVDDLIARPVDAQTAVRVALLNNPRLAASLAALGVSDAERVQAGRLPNPTFEFARLREGSRLELERLLRVDVAGLLMLPWRAQWADRQAGLARLEAAQDVVRLAADTRKAWVDAVAAQQMLAYLRDVKDAADAGAELGRRMASAGNWSRLAQAREQSVLAEATAQLARAEQAALAARERLTRLMGLEGSRAGYALVERLPDLPDPPPAPPQSGSRGSADAAPALEERALAERLDVRAARTQSEHIAAALGQARASALAEGLAIGLRRDTTFVNDAAGTREHKRGVELSVPLPLFDAGGARAAREDALYLQSLARLREVRVTARSEVREAAARRDAAFTLARHYRDEVVPLRKSIQDEMALRYNGMLASPWELLAEVRASSAAVSGAIGALRDYWLAEADLGTALTGTSPGALAALRAGAAEASASQDSGGPGGSH